MNSHQQSSRNPHITQTLGNRRALSHYLQLAEQARLERERYDQVNAALEVDALIARARSAGQLVPEEPEHPWWRDVTCWTASLFVMAGFGILLREPVVHLLVLLGWWS